MGDPPRLAPAAVRGIVFDLDGTLVDSYEAITESLNYARRRFGLAPMSAEDVRRSVGRGLETLVAEHVDPDDVSTGVRLFRERYAEVYAPLTRALPGVEDALRELHTRGLRLSVASNKPARFTRPILEAVGFAERFDAIEGPDTAGSTKPEPQMIRRCLEAMRVTPPAALYVGDMVLDVTSAARAAVAVVLVPGGSSSADELAETGQRVLASLAELTQLVGREAV